MSRTGMIVALLLCACVHATTSRKDDPAPVSSSPPVTSPARASAAPVTAASSDPDGEGVVEAIDRCPEQPETRNGFQDRDGCPDELPAELAAITGIVAGLEFEIEKDTIRPSSRPALDRIVAVLANHPDVKIRIGGHIAYSGREDYFGRDLARSRADAVQRYLIVHGIAAERVEAVGYGSSVPIASNKTEEGRKQNRRIEIVLLPQ